MAAFTLLALMAALATVVSLASGIAAMANHGEIGHLNSAQWMVLRVLFQAAAFLAVAAALIDWG